MAYVMLSNLRVVLLFICPIIESFNKVFIRHLPIDSIVVYCTTIIANTPDKIAHCMQLGVVKNWSTLLRFNGMVALKCYLCFF